MAGRLGIIADTHGDLLGWESAVRAWGPVDLIVHAGDVLKPWRSRPLSNICGKRALAEAINACGVPVLIARGNCDGEEDEHMVKWPMVEPFLFLWWNGRLVLVGHGTDFSEIRDRGLACEADVVITGHTHVASLVREGKTRFLNPGSASLPMGRDPASAALLDEEGIRIMTLGNELLHFEPW
ncbi:MAG: YfcE family phosphodiesterase [Synergistaceae bacterium]|nr:YfcE family phosphodiesterase [Synergistaceae bacterium]